MHHLQLTLSQNVTAAPGEKVEFLVMAIDQAGNPQEAIWSVTEENESKEESIFDVSTNLDPMKVI